MMKMSSKTLTAKSKSDTPKKLDRIIGSIEGAEEGPTIIVLAGMHGNEPSGVEAVENVFNMLYACDITFSGRFLGIRANLEALEQEVRFIDEDMNRIWFPAIIDNIRETAKEELESSERIEIKDLLALLDEAIPEKSDPPTILADLHSFSAEGCMFAITAPKDNHTKLLSSLHIPMIFGIEDTLRGTALRYYQDLGHVTFALEGGQHENELTVYNETAALLLLLKEVGCIEKNVIRQLKDFEKHLRKHTLHLPKKVELIYQHMIEDGDDFSMRPGYKNFQTIKKGEWLANDKDGKIYAQCDGFLLMPLYQDQGNDGFFMVQEQR